MRQLKVVESVVLQVWDEVVQLDLLITKLEGTDGSHWVSIGDLVNGVTNTFEGTDANMGILERICISFEYHYFEYLSWDQEFVDLYTATIVNLAYKSGALEWLDA